MRVINSIWLRQQIRWFLPLVLAIAVKLISLNEVLVERFYSTFFFHYVTMPLRFVMCKVPFSVGDCLYVLIALVFVYQGIVFAKRAWRLVFTLHFYRKWLASIIPNFLWLYIVFNVLWGLNYNRLGVAAQMHIVNQPYTAEQLTKVNCYFLEQMNAQRVLVGDSMVTYPSTDSLFKWCIQAYDTCASRLPFLRSHRLNIKSSLLTKVVSYAGYSGYYNPFTTEAQVNTDLPPFLLPFVCTHELAHQIGYASESEANFIAYLVCSSSSNPYFRYSAFFEMYLTANSQLYQVDYCAARVNTRSYHQWVKKDIQTYKDFIYGKQNRVEPMAKWVYDSYLKANQQTKGIESYDDVIAWIINYHEQYP